jgi:hypothetical protein
MIIFVVIFGIGCTDAKMKQMTSYGSSAFIKCYSGGQIIYSGESTGKVQTEEQSDGWYFEDSKTGKLVRVSGDCLIEN